MILKIVIQRLLVEEIIFLIINELFMIVLSKLMIKKKSREIVLET